MDDAALPVSLLLFDEGIGIQRRIPGMHINGHFQFPGEPQLPHKSLLLHLRHRIVDEVHGFRQLFQALVFLFPAGFRRKCRQLRFCFQRLLLFCFTAVIDIVIIQTDFADGHHAGLLGQLTQFRQRFLRQFCHMIRMKAHRGIDAGAALTVSRGLVSPAEGISLLCRKRGLGILRLRSGLSGALQIKADLRIRGNAIRRQLSKQQRAIFLKFRCVQMGMGIKNSFFFHHKNEPR